MEKYLSREQQSQTLHRILRYMASSEMYNQAIHTIVWLYIPPTHTQHTLTHHPLLLHKQALVLCLCGWLDWGGSCPSLWCWNERSAASSKLEVVPGPHNLMWSSGRLAPQSNCCHYSLCAFACVVGAKLTLKCQAAKYNPCPITCLLEMKINKK